MSTLGHTMAHQHLCLILGAAIALLFAEAKSPVHSYPKLPGKIHGVSTVRSCQVCSTWGNYHFKTFDGDLYQLKSDCNYVLASSCSSPYQDFSVQVRRGQGDGGRPIITRAFLSLDGVSVEITTHEVLVNGQPAVLPMSQAGVQVERSHSYIKVRAKLGLLALWSPDSFLVEVDNKYQNQTCGLCGDFNGVPLNEFYSHGAKMPLRDFASLWRKDGPTESCPESDPEPTAPSCDHMRPVCERLFYSPALTPCRPHLDVDSFLSACIHDACQCTIDSDSSEHTLSSCLCHTLSEFSRQCVRAGGRPGHWRTKKLCWRTCPLKMEYRECSSPVMDTCSNPEASSTSDEHCMDGCFCPAGTVLDDLTGKGCIPLNECFCSYNGQKYAPGESYTCKCTKCVCGSGQWTCTESNCAGTCSVEGGAHISTFDAKTYTFHGDCSYTMAKDCDGDQFVVQAELKQCGLSETETCLKAVVLALNGGAHVLTIKPSGKVFVNGIYAQLPFSTMGVTAFQASSFYVLVQTSVGVLLEVQLQPIMQLFITLESQHKNKTCGLCGNFNGNQADDFLKLSGVEEATATGFANSWKTCASCMNVRPVYQDPCTLSHDNEQFAQRWCTQLIDKNGVFASCHAQVNPEPYYQRCTYDSCNCEQSEDCMCAVVSSYFHACSAAGVHISGWREVLCGKYSSSCPVGMVYCYNITSGPGTCRCRFSSEPGCHLSFLPLDGCVCAPETYLDDSGNCVPSRKCPCYYQDTVVPAGQVVQMENAICTCRDGVISCVGQSIPPVICAPPLVYFNCSEHGSSATGKECEKSCATLDSACVSSGCTSGCMCPPGMISDDQKGCIKPEACPCVHNGLSYSPGQSIKVDCNTCVCKNRKWVCTMKLCDSTCTVYGDGHYQTFDHQRFTFDGNCEYILVQDHCNKAEGSFRVVTENIPCGSTGTTCSKTIKIFLQDSELVLTQGDYQLQGSEAPFHFSTMGLYLVIEVNNGLTLIWDRKSILFIKLSPKYKGRVCGLCGNYDGNANNDMTTRCGATVINPLVFGNSWKDSPTCPDEHAVPSPCMVNPHRLPWAHKQCSILHSQVFSACHATVDPAPYYDACVFDTCSCDTGGDCDCLCTAVAAYAEACNQASICVEWRTPDFCPIFCDYYNPPNECEWHYKPCGAPCMKTCRNPSGLCSSNIPPLEGCYPKCPPAQPYFDEVAMTCVAKDQCGCYDIKGTHFNNGDIVPSSLNCYVCTCESTTIQCHYDAKACMCLYHGVSHPFGSVLYNTTDGHGNCLTAVCGHNGTIERHLHPCPETSMTTTTPLFHFTTNEETCEETCSWTNWINSDHPEYGKKGGDDESIQRLLHKGYDVCKHPVRVECRSVQYPHKSLSELGQSVTCNTDIGFMCKNSQQYPPICLDYEIRMKCCKPGQCSTTKTTTSTTTTTTYSTTTLIATLTVPPPTACPGGDTMTCTWSQWFNLGHPSPGPNGEEVESIQDIIAAGFPICIDPVSVQCRAAQYPALSLSQLGQDVTCDKDVGLICKNNDQELERECYDYEMKVKCCNCLTLSTSTTTTTASTTTPCTTTTPTPTTPITTTVPPPTACPGGDTMTCTWSQWFNLGHPSPGPNGEEVESIQDIIAAGFPICIDPVSVQCRAAQYPALSLSQLGQDVTCDKDVGLICKNNDQELERECYDYEMKVKCCNCLTTLNTSTTTTTASTTTPCTTTTPTPTTPITTTVPPPTACPGGDTMTCTWSQWFNLGHPSPGPNGEEVESIQDIIAAGFPICIDPVSVQCRAAQYPALSLSQLGQDVTCDKDVGLICKNNDQELERECYDYEMKVKCCNCLTLSTSTTTTTASTTTPCTTTTPTPTTPITTTVPPPTACPGGDTMTCTWSQWFNLGHPSPGPNGEEVESIQDIIAAGFPICIDPVSVQCRAAQYPALSLSQLGQDVTCDKDVGLICKNNDQELERECYDYEMKVKCCNCLTTLNTSTTTTTASTTTPCTTTTPTPTTPITTTVPPPTACPGGDTMTCTWSQWFNLGHPSPGPNGEEVESIQDIIAAGFPICIDPVSVQCRAAQYPALSLSQLGQDVTCDKDVGLICKNNDQELERECYDYEMKVKCCNCLTTLNTSTTTTTASTTTPCTTTTPTPTTPITTTVPPPTACPGGDTMTCTWSQWFNLGHPSPGPSGVEIESIRDIIAAGFPICSAPESVECRAVQYPTLSISQVGQDVICDKHVGLICKNNEQGLEQKCYDYEIRVKCCECPTLSTVTTAPTSITLPTTTACPAGQQMNCEWSQWFNLGHPSPGPNGEEVESIQDIIAAGFPICIDPVSVQCRAAQYPALSLSQLGQDVTCDKDVGLICKNNDQELERECYDYEMKVRCCNCLTLSTSTTTTTASTTTPCTTTTPTPTTPITTTVPPPTACPGGDTMTCTWSQWFNLGHPSPGPNGEEVESIQDIIAAGFPICIDPVSVQCRAAQYPALSLSQLGQDVTCDKDVGLICKNNDQGLEHECYDYEMKVKCCNCLTLNTSNTTTTASTTTACTTTTPTPTTPITTTVPPPTACPGGDTMTCTWSQWFNLGHPSPGPNGEEVESIQDIIAAGFPICIDPVSVQCRAAQYPALSLSQLGQDVTCDKDVGLICKNNDQGLEHECYDYEMKVKCCNCLTLNTSNTTTTASTTTPCTTTTPTPTTPITTTVPPPTACPGGDTMTCTWSQWFNLGHPSPGPNGEEVESIQDIIAAGFPICIDPVSVQCRAAQYPALSLSQLGQDVTCDKDVGLICKNNDQELERECYDYEMKVKCCNCLTLNTSTTTTTASTTTPCTTTTPTPTTPITTTVPPPTACPGGDTMTCTWSQWFNLGHPSPGPSGVEIESIRDIIAAGFPICSAPESVECRAVQYPTLSISQVGQDVICDKHVGLICKNNEQGLEQKCYDYEIRVKCCECPTTSITPATATTPATAPVTTCTCSHNGVTFSPGSTVYNYTDFEGYCYIGYCNQSCDVVVLHYQCLTMTTVPPSKDCLYLKPPRKDGEVWRKSGCRIGTCKNGEVIISKLQCPIPEPIICANNFPPVKVYDHDGCCWHYECQCICYGWGDTHYVTFDGTFYNFQGDCSYWLVKEVFPRYGFSVMITNNNCGESYFSTCPQSITVFYHQYKIYMSQINHHGILTNVIMVNNKAVHYAYQTPKFRITTTGIITVLVIPSIKAKIIFSGFNYNINLPLSLFGSNTQGLCGNCDNNRGDDCTLPNSHIKCSCVDMAHEWHTNDSYCPPPPPTTANPTPPHCNCSICDIIKSKVFQECHGVLDYHAFIVACRLDVCTADDPHVACLSLQEYAASCAEAGVCIDWRCATHGLCDYQCASPKVYEACGPLVEHTCDSWFNHKFIYTSNDFTAMILNQRMEGCYCPNGTTLLSSYSNECVPSCEICRLPNGKWAEANATWTEGCELCRCDEDTLQVVCEKKLCPTVHPPHCEHEGQVLVTDIVDCCPRCRCECNKSLCTGMMPLCLPGTTLNTTVGVCCDKYVCVPKEVCVFNNHEYQVGEVVPRGPCERCVCSEKRDPNTFLHLLDCHPLPCDTHCSPGYEYQLVPGQCCGRCVQSCCIVTLGNVSHTLQPGELWSPDGNPCVKFECVRIGNQFLTVETKTVCPPFEPQDCIPGTETVASDGCCRVCIPRGHPCSVSTSAIVLESQGCKSAEPVNMTSCSGACGTFTYYSSKTRSLQYSCSCCREVTTTQRKVVLLCPDLTQISYIYTHITACACLKTTCSVLGHALPYAHPTSMRPFTRPLRGR